MEAEIPVPLVEAAARLGLTTDALRARLRRGRARGERRNGRVFVYLSPGDVEPRRPVWTMSGQGETERAQPNMSGVDSAELDRLRQDNERLNRRVDDLLRLQEREQVLRQQTQAFLDKIGDRLALPGTGPSAAGTDVRERLQRNEEDVEVLKTAIAQLVRYLGKRES